MKGSQHLLLAILSAILLLLPCSTALAPWQVAVIAAGVALGSLAPDADTKNAAILRRPSEALAHDRRSIGPFDLAVPFFGYAFRYLVYYPLAAVCRITMGSRYRHEHRGLLHTPVGLALATAMLSGYMALGCGSLGELVHIRMPASGIALFALSFLGGALSHLLMDSCTVRGISWSYPFRVIRLQGSLITGRGSPLRPLLPAAALALAILVVLHTMHGGEQGFISPSLVSISALAGIWGTFLLSCGVRARQG